MDKRIVVNAIMTPDGTILQSKHQHDFVSHIDKKTHSMYAVDGGLYYLKRCFSEDKDYIEISLYEDDPHEQIREMFCWGSYGAYGDEPLHWIKLKDLSIKHIDAIVRMGTRDYIRTLLLNEIKWRLKDD